MLIPRDLRVVVGVDVDEAGGHELVTGVDLFAARTGNGADFDDEAIAHGDVGLVRLAARAIGYRSTSDYEIEHARLALVASDRIDGFVRERPAAGVTGRSAVTRRIPVESAA